ncbi:MAG: sigma-70 family RNA polymerase sigma factor [Polyangiaceae bacterium]
MTARPPNRDATFDAYRHFAPYVRRCLADAGVRSADIPDLCHEVFLIVHAKAESLGEVTHFDLWVKEVCRRVAAGYRRRASYRREVFSSEPVPDGAAPQPDPADTLGQDELVLRALAGLDDESRELLALHDVGDLPLTELARLTLHDRKTVRKRLQLARKRLLAQMREVERSGALDTEPSAPPPSGVATLSDFELLTVTPDVRLALLGNVAISHWPAAPSAEAFDQLLHFAPYVIEKGGGSFVYLALVDSIERPGPLARRKIVECLERFGDRLLQYGTALLCPGAWIAQPIMSGLMVLARPRFPMRFFTSSDAAATWICNGCALGPSGPLPFEQLQQAVERLRTLNGVDLSALQSGG